MKVLVTGGTGFVGAHTVAALIASGHTARLLVRTPSRVAPALDPLGVTDGVETVTGDITDRASVEAAVEGCDAAIHAAAVVSFDRRNAARTSEINVEGTRTVLGTAWRAGLDPILYVSSVSALHPPTGPVLTPSSPVTPPSEVYAGSKAAAELAARDLQEQGAPVVITYPGGVWGPHDPNIGESTRGTIWLLRLGIVPQTGGGYLLVDVRDLGRVHVAALVAGQGPRRYMAGGTWFTGKELAALVSSVTGRRIVSTPSPGWSLRATGRIGDRIQSLLKIELPFTAEGMATIVRSVPTDDSATHDELGVAWRDPAVTVSDTLRWLLADGHLTRRQVGRRLADLA
jgi:nucleoside-diphosphate-sugar epimerase